MLILRRATLSSVGLDLVRGLAALFVFLGHCRLLFFADYGQVEPQGRLIQGLYFVTGLGHQCVIVFFVLSGLVISSSVARALAEGRWSWRWYLENRLSRLYIVLLPALLLGAFWDHLGMGLHGLRGVYGHAPEYRWIINFDIADRAGPGAWFGNLLFLQGILVDSYGSNSPLWSLSYELWYYLIFPALAVAVVRGPKSAVRALHLLLAAVILLGVGKRIALYFLIWLMGSFVALAPRPPQAFRRPLAALSLTAILGLFVLLRLQLLRSELAADFALGAFFAAALYALLDGDGREAPPALYRASQLLAGSSYTLYLVHVPLLVFLSGTIIGEGHRWQPDLAHLGLGVLIGAVVFGYALLVAHFTEARTDALRRRLRQR